MTKKSMIKSNNLYDRLKFVTQVLIPGVGSLYFALSQIWGIPGAAKVVGTLTVIDTFMGVLLHLNSQVYLASDAQYDGSVDITETDAKKSYSLNLNSDPSELDGKKRLVFKVNPKKK